MTLLEERNTSKRARVEIDSNKVFADIESIKAAQDKVARQQEE